MLNDNGCLLFTLLFRFRLAFLFWTCVGPVSSAAAVVAEIIIDVSPGHPFVRGDRRMTVHIVAFEASV